MTALPYSHSPIVSRPPVTFPGGARLAFYVGLNIERFRPEVSLDPADPDRVPDPMAHGWRDYGNRVGIWRLMEILDDVGLRASGIVNSEVCHHFPEIIEAGTARNWAWVAHGKTNSIMQTGMTPEQERPFVEEMLATLDTVLPARPRGWLGPGLTETALTPHLLAEHGFDYVLDWCSDDQPFDLDVPGMSSVPYSLDVNDYVMFMTTPGLSGQDYERIVLDHFEQLLEDSVSTGRVMALPLHTFITGQPYRARALARVLRTITSTSEVWLCTSDDIAQHHRDHGEPQGPPSAP